MSAYVSLNCPKHGWSDVDTSAVGCPACEIDHIHRAVTLAKIEVLEEMLSRLGGYSNSTKGYCEAKIAALRKELGDE